MSESKKSVLMLAAIIGATVLFGAIAWNMPPSVAKAIEDALPDQHYENGTLIRTVRGQDFIVTDNGHGGEYLTPIQKDAPMVTVEKTNYVRVEQ